MKRILITSLLPLTLAVLAACSPATPPAEPIRAVRTITLATASVGGAHDYAAEVRARTESRNWTPAISS